MTNASSEYEKICADLAKSHEVISGQMFGKACLKVNGKAFLAQHKETVVFKLADSHHAKAMALEGAHLWDPSGKGRAMKQWVALPASASRSFPNLGKAALAFVRDAA